jgi:hypothetical protein
MIRISTVLGRAKRRIKSVVARRRNKAHPSNRLHLGCGSDYWEGWVNVDTDPRVGCDLRADFTEIGGHFESESVAEVAMIHSVSYLRLWQARDLFREIHRILAPGGRLTLEFPDILKCATRALECGSETDDYLEAVRGIYAFDMEQIQKRATYTPYAFGWSVWHITVELRRAGFVEVCAEEPQTHGPRPWRDSRIVATKRIVLDETRSRVPGRSP